MTTGNVARIMRVPGRLVANPTTAFATTTFPYGGTELGKVNQCAVRPVGEPPFEIVSEALGEPTDVLGGDNRYIFGCFLRGWDDDAVEVLRPGEYVEGGTSSHAMFDANKSIPGRSLLTSETVVLALVPDDPLHTNGILIYRGVPQWTDAAEMAFQRRAELGIPITVVCVRDDNDNMMRIGRIADLELDP